jgi:hypothetical protein
VRPTALLPTHDTSPTNVTCTRAVLFCTWGARGATALDVATGELVDYTSHANSSDQADEFVESGVVEYVSTTAPVSVDLFPSHEDGFLVPWERVIHSSRVSTRGCLERLIHSHSKFQAL